MTKLITMVEAIAKRVNVSTKIEHEVTELTRDVAPETVLDKLDDSTVD